MTVFDLIFIDKTIGEIKRSDSSGRGSLSFEFFLHLNI